MLLWALISQPRGLLERFFELLLTHMLDYFEHGVYVAPSFYRSSTQKEHRSQLVWFSTWHIPAVFPQLTPIQLVPIYEGGVGWGTPY